MADDLRRSDTLIHHAVVDMHVRATDADVADIQANLARAGRLCLAVYQAELLVSDVLSSGQWGFLDE